MTIETNNPKIAVKTEEGVELPFYATDEAAGADVRAHLRDSALSILPGKTALVPTGLYFDIPKGYEIQVRPRSGLALKFSITVLNTPGTIDSDYRGELKVILINHGQETFEVENGMRIAQIVVAKCSKAIFTEAQELSTTLRGHGGFGHSGTT